MRALNVPDIDEKDLENAQLCAEYTVDVYSYLRCSIYNVAVLWWK